MKVAFLGTNGWYDTDTGNTVCTLLQTEGQPIIFDAGNGIYKVDSVLSASGQTTAYLLLSHFHLDHVIGLHILSSIRSFRKLVIAGPAGTRNYINIIANKPFTLPLADLPYPVDIVELPDENNRIPFTVECAPLLHAGLTLGFRVAVDGKVVTYCPDTGYCENAVRLARESDLLITECAYRSGETRITWPHLNPESAAQIAREASARQLALVHFDASRYENMAARKEAEAKARLIFSNTFAAFDGLQITV